MNPWILFHIPLAISFNFYWTDQPKIQHIYTPKKIAIYIFEAVLIYFHVPKAHHFWGVTSVHSNQPTGACSANTTRFVACLSGGWDGSGGILTKKRDEVAVCFLFKKERGWSVLGISVSYIEVICLMWVNLKCMCICSRLDIFQYTVHFAFYYYNVYCMLL